MDLEHMIHGDMPGDKIAIEQGHIDKAEKIYPALRERLGPDKTVVCVCGGSGVGKSEIASLLAAEVGANKELAKRAALLHDIGKGAENDSDQNHAEVGAEMARKMGEDPKVINAIAAHHNDVEATTLEAVIVQIADAISAARPGARRETVDNYVKRLENLEETAEKFPGVEKAYAIQAGRELRILVNNEKIPDGDVKELAQKIAKQIETDIRYPGRIKLTMIRETRIVEYAR